VKRTIVTLYSSNVCRIYLITYKVDLNQVKNTHQLRKYVTRFVLILDVLIRTAPKIRDAVTAKPFNKVYSNYILQSPLVATP
jgi:hypothetical protein